ncbi:hypothetical protein GCQ56_15650 [Marinifilum sp. N1E240]|uniref:hypothetical protein n=1 Tax=Marinifilum sp. N1E240 TaxID=2608082 RepID=UPI00128C7732|nr:hypothetical protein [Marinifilum sp. N1E240]MPQ48439.1 hypothetical protein [Marinifilum sp. N1E240]
MEKEIKNKLKFVAIGFCILLIPIGFFLKYSYGVHLNDTAVNDFWVRHYGEKNVGLESIEKLEQAKKYCKRNKLIYYNQSRIQSILGDNTFAINTINEWLEIEPNDIQAIRLQGFYYELNNQISKADKNYLKVKSYSEKEPKNIESELTVLMNDFILKDTLGFSERIEELTVKYKQDRSKLLFLETLKEIDRKEFIKQQIQ